MPECPKFKEGVAFEGKQHGSVATRPRWQDMEEPDYLIKIDWPKWERAEERLARLLPGALTGQIIRRREALDGVGEKMRPESLYYFLRSLDVLEGIAARLGVVV